MNLPTELERLADLHASGALTDDEFAAAKAALLEGNRPGGGSADDALAVSREQLRELQRANAVAQLDREWGLERETYLMTGQHDDDGHTSRYRPTRGGSIVGGIVVTLFGCFWTFSAASLTSEASHFGGMMDGGMMDGGMGTVMGLFPLFGLLFVAAGLWTSYHGYTSADALEIAERNYKHRRAALLAGRGDPGPAPARAADEGSGAAGETDIETDLGDTSDREPPPPGRDDGIFFG